MSASASVVTPLMRLQDPGYSRVLIVTLAETTVAEAAELQDDLRRAGIELFGWVVNATLCGSRTADPVLRARAALEHAQLARIATLDVTRVGAALESGTPTQRRTRRATRLAGRRRIGHRMMHRPDADRRGGSPRVGRAPVGWDPRAPMPLDHFIGRRRVG